MLTFLLFAAFSIGVFLLSLVGYNKYRSTTLYALAIGGVVNAGFFHAGAYPIECFHLPFGIDSIIYTLFAYCVIVMWIKDSKQSAYLLAFSSIIAILFSATMQLVADLFSNGSSWLTWSDFLFFVSSALSSAIAVIAAVEILEACKRKLSPYAALLLGISIISVLYGCIHYPVSILLNELPQDLWALLLAALIGRIVAILSALFAFFCIDRYEQKQKKL